MLIHPVGIFSESSSSFSRRISSFIISNTYVVTFLLLQSTTTSLQPQSSVTFHPVSVLSCHLPPESILSCHRPTCLSPPLPPSLLSLYSHIPCHPFCPPYHLPSCLNPILSPSIQCLSSPVTFTLAYFLSCHLSPCLCPHLSPSILFVYSPIIFPPVLILSCHLPPCLHPFPSPSILSLSSSVSFPPVSVLYYYYHCLILNKMKYSITTIPAIILVLSEIIIPSYPIVTELLSAMMINLTIPLTLTSLLSFLSQFAVLCGERKRHMQVHRIWSRNNANIFI